MLLRPGELIENLSAYPCIQLGIFKGAVGISLHMNDTRVCFVNAHFAAHLEENERRIQDYRLALQ